MVFRPHAAPSQNIPLGARSVGHYRVNRTDRRFRCDGFHGSDGSVWCQRRYGCYGAVWHVGCQRRNGANRTDGNNRADLNSARADWPNGFDRCVGRNRRRWRYGRYRANGSGWR